ncbi:SNF1-related protein kinase regulatory subunit beta-1 isoform X2 [Ricinus communis]|uniref:SNF1-related protein kinase regulatory subunit beta-1 isoform X2 n=1 Tax=Ricinus communis TaxID=3988 RepID=UPI00201A7FE9|nr:SNF1-related protein kinase regulatory subunit beta-1 isoform X2 [Ricinus communis]
MGNVNGREEGGGDEDGSNSNAIQSASSDSMPNALTVNNHHHHHHHHHLTNNTNNNTPPHSPARSSSPLLFAPQVPVAPLQRVDGPPFLNQMRRTESPAVVDYPSENGIPTIISWNYGGNEVFVEGSWDNWMSRKLLHRSDGEWRYIPDLPFVADEMGRICNLLDVDDYVPENLDSVAGFEAPQSPDSTYSQSFPTEEDFAKEPLVVPQQLHLTVLGVENQNEVSSSKPQHVVLNHLFIEKGWASHSLVALGLTHRFESKYVTVVLYKPHKR